jgi:hypothetical protein
MTIQYDNLKAALIRVTGEPDKRGRFKCPSHGGDDYNLAIRDGDKKVQITCFSHKCDGVDILESLDMKLSDIYYENKLSKKTANWVLTLERLEWCFSIISLAVSTLERNPNHDFSEQDLRAVCKAKTELEQHYLASYGGEI